MVDRPILRFPDPVASRRRTGAPRSPPRPQGPGRAKQGRRFQATFHRLADALDSGDPAAILREDPAGIAPERALVFVTAGSVQDFARAARQIGLEVFGETELEATDEYPEGFEPAENAEKLSRTLYATMPTLASIEQILTLWNAHQRGERAPRNAAPWWQVFDRLLELRKWGPEDRLTESARAVIEDRLPFDENADVSIEFEIWPTSSANKRAAWTRETESRIDDLGGRVLARSSIAEAGFTYAAVLASLPVLAVRAMLDNPYDLDGLATIEGVQFVLPQTIGQAPPGDVAGDIREHEPKGPFAATAPIRAALLDGTPAAAHEMLDGGVVIEDIHDLVRLSEVDRRYHATAMASLILRGDLEADGTALQDTRLLSVPLLIDHEDGERSPENKLFVDLLHVALTRLFAPADALAPDVFVINFSVCVRDGQFSGRMSALARLMDWWASREGILFIVSAGNIGEGLTIAGMTSRDFEDAVHAERRAKIEEALRASTFARTLLAPAEAINVVTVGAISRDLNGQTPPNQAGTVTLEAADQTLPQVASAVGLGLHRAIKPDIVAIGGRLEVRSLPNGDELNIRPLNVSQRTGLIAAAPRGSRGTQRTRGTSAAAALTTRAILQSAEALTGEGGPFEGQELARQTLALLTRALAVNGARWPIDALNFYDQERERLGHHSRAKEEVCRRYGYGVLSEDRMRESPEAGVTMVGHDVIRKDEARIFRMPLPPSMSGDRVPRTVRATLAWFSPVNPSRAQYRLAGLEALIAADLDAAPDEGWGLGLKSDGPDKNMVKRGSVWSRRLIQSTMRVPEFGEGASIPICVQCRDTAAGALSPDDEIAFAIAVTLEVEADVQYDILPEIEQALRVPIRRGAR